MNNEKQIWETFQLVPLKELKQDVGLFNFQQYSIFQCLSNNVFINGLQTGLGKTVCSYASYFYYLTKYPKTKLVIVTPKTAILQFEKELYKFFDYQGKSVSIHEKMLNPERVKYKEIRKQTYQEFGQEQGSENSIDIILMGYAIFRIDHNEIYKQLRKLRESGHNIFVIYDEATAFSNMQTQTFKAVRAVSKIANKRIGLSATITKGKLEQVYAIYKGLNHQITSTKREFLENFCITFKYPNTWHYKITGYKNLDQFKELIKPYSIIFRKADVAPQLPKFTLRKIYLEHSKEQFKLIKDIYSGEVDISDYSEEEMDESQEFIQAITEVGHIKRVLLDPRLFTKKDLKEYKNLQPKTAELVRLLNDEFSGEKIVIYSPSRVYIDYLFEVIKVHAPDIYNIPLKIHGGITGTDREDNKELFQSSPDHNIMITNILEAMNLQSASTVVVTSMPSTGGNLIQLMGRISRIGSLHSNLFVTYLLTKDSQDEDEYLIINEQLYLMSTILGEAEEGLIDWEILTKNSSTGEMTKEEYINKSAIRLLLSKRKKRERFYKK